MNIETEKRLLRNQKLKLISIRDDLNKSIQSIIDIELALIKKTEEQS